MGLSSPSADSHLVVEHDLLAFHDGAQCFRATVGHHVFGFDELAVAALAENLGRQSADLEQPNRVVDVVGQEARAGTFALGVGRVGQPPPARSIEA